MMPPRNRKNFCCLVDFALLYLFTSQENNFPEHVSLIEKM